MDIYSSHRYILRAIFLYALLAMNFTQLNLTSSLLAALPAGINQPTKIQQLVIPPALENQDLLALAQTGSGKTLAFGLPLLQSIDSRIANVQALVVVPTRELAEQVTTALQVIAEPLDIKLVTLCGGIAQTKQLTRIDSGAQLIIATPGRLLDLLQQREITLVQAKQLVLDEADRLLDMGFWPDIQKIIEFLPITHQTLLFSATLPAALEYNASQILNQPLRVEAHTTNSVVDTVEEQLYLVNKGSKPTILKWLIEQNKWQQVLVFISARDSADSFAKKLRKAGLSVAALHGEKDQTERQRTLKDFKQKKLQVIVATDVLARGIHIEALPVVINLDLPANAPVYVHRVGRTARTGQTGIAISLVSHGEIEALNAIRKLTQRDLPLATIDEFPVTDKPASGLSKRPPKDKQANRRTAKKRSAKQFKPRS